MTVGETTAQIQRGWCDDELAPFVPGINCLVCGRFVGRDGHISVETFEMSSTVASVEGECARCLSAETTPEGRS